MNYCHKCKKYFHYLGIARHRAMHRDKKERVEITNSKGKKHIYEFDKK